MSEIKPEKFVPKVMGDNCVIFMFRLDKCEVCKKYMIEQSILETRSLIDSFLYNQISNADMKLRYDLKVDVGYICTDCKKEGKATFRCSACNETKPTTYIKEYVGDLDKYPDFIDILCVTCYETLPAKNWIEKRDSLISEHIFDYD